MKKIYLTLTAIIICVGYGLLSWDLVTHSAPPKPEDSPYYETCSSTRMAGDSLPITTANECCIEYHEALDAAKRDWDASLQQLINQERPASAMVDDGYESLRTLNCWMEYICRAVQYSGHAPIESIWGTGLKEVHLGVVPGCQSPENVTMESEYNKFVDSLKEIPLFGVPASLTAGVVVETYGDVYQSIYENVKRENILSFFPLCMTDNINNESPNLSEAKANYDACKSALEFNFGCPEGMDQELCTDTSNAFVMLENVLRKRQGDQKAAALEKKLGTIVPKLQGMEGHVDYLSNFLQQLDARFACYAGKCS